jgi:hypothetical protein
MAKTRRSRGKKHGSERNKCKYPSTMFYLNKWYMDMFEQLGWMVLAKKKGMNDKIKEYKLSLGRLKSHLECKIDEVQEVDRKVDLNILLENVKILIAHVDKDFK